MQPSSNLKSSYNNFIGNWTFSVSSNKQISHVPVEITNNEIIFTYCNDIRILYRISNTSSIITKLNT